MSSSTEESIAEVCPEGETDSCPICFREVSAGQKLCRSCFGNLPAVPEERAVVPASGMAGPGEALAMAGRFLVLDREAILETAKSPRFAPIGAVVTTLGIAGSLAPAVTGFGTLAGLTMFKFLAVYLPAVLLTHAMARMMGGTGTYGQLFRAFNITNLVYAVGLIPIAAVATSMLNAVALWDLVVSTYVLMVVHGISAPRAIWIQAATITALIGAFMAFPILGI